MAFNHKFYISKFVTDPSNDAVQYGVTIDRAQAQKDETYFQVIGVHHLTPSENRGNRNAYIDVLNENNQRLRGALIGWDWVGRRPNEPANPAIVDKPDNEPGTNISIGSNQVISVWVMGGRSDRVINISTIHPDEPGPHGENWNSIGHHSFYIIFKRVKKGSSTPPPDVEEPDKENPKTDFIKTFVVYEDTQIKVTQTVELK